VQQYRSANPAFPHESTGDQFYSEDQFESYRTLGREAATEAFGRYRETESLRSFVANDLRAILNPEVNTEGASSRHTVRLNDLYARLGREAGLKAIAHQFSRGIEAPPLPEPKLSLEQHYFCMEALQLMEDVFVDLSLDDTFDHPDSRGWRETFEYWVKADAMNQVWQSNRMNFGARFAQFWLRLGGR
jgi:hypothetical protein